MTKRVIAVDFDGTLAHYDGYKGPGVLGEPVLSMLDKVKRWIAEGHEIIIFTARVCVEHDLHGVEDVMIEIRSIHKWLEANGLPMSLTVTCVKHKRITEIWDDRAVAVRKNTGEGFVPPPPGYNYMLVKADEVLGNATSFPIKPRDL